MIFYALLDNPDAYERGVAELLQTLVNGTRKTEHLTKDELELLDRSVIDFTSAKRPKPKEEEKKVEPRRERTLIEEKLNEEEEEAEEEHERLFDVPVSAPTFWWRK